MSNPAGIARRVFAAYNTRDPEALRTLYAPTARTRRPGWPDDGDVDELVASAEMDVVAFPHLRLAPVFSVTEGGATMSEVHITGTNTGEIVLSDFGRVATGTTGDTFPATGRSMDITGVIVHETDDDGLIVAERQYWNMLELLAQLGMFVPMPEG
jgi:ketosteroid isomerase-like protein